MGTYSIHRSMWMNQRQENLTGGRGWAAAHRQPWERIRDAVSSEQRQEELTEGVGPSTETGLQRGGLLSYPQLCPRDRSSALGEDSSWVLVEIILPTF